MNLNLSQKFQRTEDVTITTPKYPYVPLSEELKETWSNTEEYSDPEEKGDLIMTFLKYSRKSNYKPNMCPTLGVFSDIRVL